MHNPLYALSSGKNPKWLYYLRAYLRYAVPRPLLRLCYREPQRVLRLIEEHPERAYIEERIAYYCQLTEPVSLPEDSPRLGEHRLQKPKVYFFDSYEFTRFFPDELRWQFLPGDIIHVPPHPTIVKSRPLTADNRNSVLMKLDKVRHFTYVKDKKPWRSKMDKVIFRGKVMNGNGGEQGAKLGRQRFMELYFRHPMCDLGDVSRQSPNPEWLVGKRTIPEHLDYKFIMALEGNDVASNLKWVMSSSSIAVMPRPTCETWFMEGRLIPNHHYIEIKSDYSDLEERLRYYIEHPEEAERIIAHANAYVAQFRDEARERLISLGVLARYFAHTNPEG